MYLFNNNAVVMVLSLIFDLSVLSQTEIGGTLPLASAWMFYIRHCSFAQQAQESFESINFSCGKISAQKSKTWLGWHCLSSDLDVYVQCTAYLSDRKVGAPHIGDILCPIIHIQYLAHSMLHNLVNSPTTQKKYSGA